MNRFPHDSTTEIIVPLPHRRGVHVLFPLDCTLTEWSDAETVVRGWIAEKRAAEGLPAGKRLPSVASNGQ